MLLSEVCLMSVSVWRLSVAYIGNNSITERLRKTKIGTQVAHVTRDLDTTFTVKTSKVNLQGRGNIVADSRTSLISLIFTHRYWKQDALGVAGVRDGLQLGCSVRASATGVQGHIVSPRAQLVSISHCK